MFKFTVILSSLAIAICLIAPEAPASFLKGDGMASARIQTQLGSSRIITAAIPASIADALHGDYDLFLGKLIVKDFAK